MFVGFEALAAVVMKSVVRLKLIDVSGVHDPSIFRVEEKAKQEVNMEHIASS
jgi:hypothetical protein